MTPLDSDPSAPGRRSCGTEDVPGPNRRFQNMVIRHRHVGGLPYDPNGKEMCGALGINLYFAIQNFKATGGGLRDPISRRREEQGRTGAQSRGGFNPVSTPAHFTEPWPDAMAAVGHRPLDSA